MTSQQLLRNLTLGTGRETPDREVHDYLELRDAVDPTAGAAEQLLAAWAIQERVHRLHLSVTEPPASSTPVAEDRPLPGPKLTRALRLVFEDTYAALLPEAISVLDDRGLRFPPTLLPGLLGFAHRQYNEQPGLANFALRTAGNRGAWLAAQHPEWQVLVEDQDYPAAFTAAAGPAAQRVVLERWRRHDPAAAREALREIWSTLKPTNQEMILPALATGLSAADVAWLKSGLAPKRKGVRRAILELLLLAGDDTTTEEMIQLAVHSLDAKGGFVNILPEGDQRKTLHRYGGLKKEHLGEYLLYYLPPHVLPDLVGKTYAEFWSGLSRTEMKAAARAIHRYQSRQAGPAVALLAYALIANQGTLPLPQVADVIADLPQKEFLDTIHQYMDAERQGFMTGGPTMLLPLARNQPWSERLSKAYVHALIAKVRDLHALPYTVTRKQAELWKKATPLLHPATLPFLRQHLHAMTGRPDAFGQLALTMLQTTSFRTLLYKA